MPCVHVAEETTAHPEAVIAAARDFSARRAELWPDVHVEQLEVHAEGETWAEVTEGNPWPIKPGSTRQLQATPRAGGGSRVVVTANRRLKGLRGRSLCPFFPLGLARRDVAGHLRHFLSTVESGTWPRPTSEMG